MQVGYVVVEEACRFFWRKREEISVFFFFSVLGVLNLSIIFLKKKYFNEKSFHYQYFLQPF